MLPPARAAVLSSASSRALPPESLPFWSSRSSSCAASRVAASCKLAAPASCLCQTAGERRVDLRCGVRSLRVCTFTSYPRARILQRMCPSTVLSNAPCLQQYNVYVYTHTSVRCSYIIVMFAVSLGGARPRQFINRNTVTRYIHQ
jgi:hypothetical protein